MTEWTGYLKKMLRNLSIVQNSLFHRFCKAVYDINAFEKCFTALNMSYLSGNSNLTCQSDEHNCIAVYECDLPDESEH